MADFAAEDAAYDAAVKAEWGRYVANGPVYINGALAFTDGSSVPASTVERFDLIAGGYVRGPDEPKPSVVSGEPDPAPVGAPIDLDPPTEPPVDAGDPPADKK